jgi:hypothetical protein
LEEQGAANNMLMTGDASGHMLPYHHLMGEGQPLQHQLTLEELALLQLL